MSDAQRSAAFYRDVLGFAVVQETAGGRAVFMRAGGSSNHHDLGLFSVGSVESSGESAALRLGAPRPGLYHLAWQVDTIDELVELRRLLGEARALTGESDHGVSKSIYGRDPDGIEFEVMWMVPESDWGRYATDAVVEPLDLSSEHARWSGMTTRV